MMRDEPKEFRTSNNLFNNPNQENRTYRTVLCAVSHETRVSQILEKGAIVLSCLIVQLILYCTC